MSNKAVAMLVGSLILGGRSVSAAPLAGFVVAAETAHFTFYSRGAEKVDSAKAEKYVTEIERLLGQSAGHADYYRYGRPEDIAAGIGQYVAGVTFPRTGQIHTTEAFHAHEIVHLVAGQMGDPGVFFQEGLAVALGNQGRWNGLSVDKIARGTARKVRISVVAAGFASLDAETAYPVAGSFVAGLIKTHGLAKVSAFFRACTSPSDRDAAFARTFGRTLDEAGQEWAANL